MHKLVLLLFVSFTMAFTSMGQTSKEIEFAKKIVDVFTSKSFDNYKRLTPTKADIEELYNDKGVIHGLGVNSDEKYMKAMASFEKTADSNYRAEFNRILIKGNEIGIDWTQITFLKFVFQADKPENSNITFLSGHINFKYKDSVYVLFGLEAAETKSGYKINMIRTVLKGGVGQYVDLDLLDDDM
jgi:hypothetical protein